MRVTVGEARFGQNMYELRPTAVGTPVALYNNIRTIGVLQQYLGPLVFYDTVCCEPGPWGCSSGHPFMIFLIRTLREVLEPPMRESLRKYQGLVPPIMG